MTSDRITSSAGEDEQVAFVSKYPMGAHPNAAWSQDVIENVCAAMREGRSAAAVVREAETWLLPPGVSRKTYMAAVRYELRAYAPSHGSAAR